MPICKHPSHIITPISGIPSPKQHPPKLSSSISSWGSKPMPLDASRAWRGDLEPRSRHVEKVQTFWHSQKHLENILDPYFPCWCTILWPKIYSKSLIHLLCSSQPTHGSKRLCVNQVDQWSLQTYFSHEKICGFQWISMDYYQCFKWLDVDIYGLIEAMIGPFIILESTWWTQETPIPTSCAVSQSTATAQTFAKEQCAS